MSNGPQLLPTVSRFRRREGFFRLSEKVPIALGLGSDDSDFRAALAFREHLGNQTGLTLPIETHARLHDLGPRIELRRDGGDKESYRLRIRPSGILATGNGRAGLRYAVESLAQLAAQYRMRIPACDVVDRPRFGRRGVLLDISRGKVPTLEALKDFVDLMASLKLNLLMLYTEHVFRFRRHPEIGEGASPMSASELRELDAYARDRHVELVPALQSLGHMHHILKIPRYRHLAESERLWSISPARRGSYRLLSDLYSEYLPNFSSEWFNANCDEPVDLGKGLSKRWAAREGRGAVYRTHLERVRNLAAKLGKKTMIWSDVVHEHPEEIPRLSRELLLLDWWYEADHDFDRVRVFAKHGIAFMVCPGTSSWNTLFPRIDNALANIRGYAESGKRYGATGLVTTDWGDGGHYNLLGNSLFCLAWGAQASWGAVDVDERDFVRAFSMQLFSDRSGVSGRIYRRLGSLHGTGFSQFNHSPLKSLLYDDLTAPRFTDQVRPRRLRSTLGRLRQVKRDFGRAEDRFSSRPTEREELRFAIDASILAAEKGLAGHEFLLWKRRRVRHGRRARERLARRLSELASQLVESRRKLRRIWLARNRPSNFEITSGYYDVAIKGLRSAARSLRAKAARR